MKRILICALALTLMLVPSLRADGPGTVASAPPGSEAASHEVAGTGLMATTRWSTIAWAAVIVAVVVAIVVASANRSPSGSGGGTGSSY